MTIACLRLGGQRTILNEDECCIYLTDKRPQTQLFSEVLHASEAPPCTCQKDPKTLASQRGTIMQCMELPNRT